jgi:hypothetical protein
MGSCKTPGERWAPLTCQSEFIMARKFPGNYPKKVFTGEEVRSLIESTDASTAPG